MSVPNNSPATAIPLTLPSSVTLDLSLSYGDGAWYSYVAVSAVGFELAIQVFPYPAGIYDPTVFLYLNATPDPADPPSQASALLPAQMPVTLGQTYYFQVFTASAPPAGTMATFTVTLAPNGLMPLKSVFSPPEVDTLRGLLFNTIDGSLVKAIPFAACQSGDILADGHMASEVRNPSNTVTDIALYRSDFTQTDLVGAAGFHITGDQVGAFYYVNPGGSPATVSAVDPGGAPVGGGWTLTTDSVRCMGVGKGGHKLYWAETDEGSTSGLPVRCFDLDGDTALTNFAAAISHFVVHDILVLTDGTVLVLYIKFTDTTQNFIRHFAANGATLHDYLLSAYAESYVNDKALARDPDGADSFWLQKVTSSSHCTFTQIKTSDGSILNALPFDIFLSGVGRNGTTQQFGPDEGAPFFIIPSGMPPIPPTTPAQWRLHRFDLKPRAEETA